jgi:hypothetical protein
VAQALSAEGPDRLRRSSRVGATVMATAANCGDVGERRRTNNQQAEYTANVGELWRTLADVRRRS